MWYVVEFIKIGWEYDIGNKDVNIKMCDVRQCVCVYCVCMHVRTHECVCWTGWN